VVASKRIPTRVWSLFSKCPAASQSPLGGKNIQKEHSGRERTSSFFAYRHLTHPLPCARGENTRL